MASKERKGMKGWMEKGRKEGREGETKGLWGGRKERQERKRCQER